MKYQVIKHLKTKAKLIKLVDTLDEALTVIKELGFVFNGLSYIGNFPYFIKKNDTSNMDTPKTRPITIQGYNEHFGVVCSIPKEDIEQLTN